MRSDSTEPTSLLICVFTVESAWEDPHGFHPERWYSRPEMIRDERAFAPFGVGKLI